MSGLKIIEGLQDAIDGNIESATFVGMDFGDRDMGAVHCPKCQVPSSWSHPDTPPTNCWNCGVRFRYLKHDGSR